MSLALGFLRPPPPSRPNACGLVAGDRPAAHRAAAAAFCPRTDQPEDGPACRASTPGRVSLRRLAAETPASKRPARQQAGSPQSGEKLGPREALVVLGRLPKVRGRAPPALPHVPEGSVCVQVTGLESAPNISAATASSSVTQHFFLLKTNNAVLKGSEGPRSRPMRHLGPVAGAGARASGPPASRLRPLRPCAAACSAGRRAAAAAPRLPAPAGAPA